MPQRRPLGEIDGNHRIRKELKPIKRAQIVGAATCGLTISQIAKGLEIPSRTVQTTLRRDLLRKNHESLSGRGKRPKSSPRDIVRIVEYVRAHPKQTYNEIRANVALTFSRSTLQRILKPYHITK
jgi:hypothetical protein